MSLKSLYLEIAKAFNVTWVEKNKDFRLLMFFLFYTINDFMFSARESGARFCVSRLHQQINKKKSIYIAIYNLQQSTLVFKNFSLTWSCEWSCVFLNKFAIESDISGVGDANTKTFHCPHLLNWPASQMDDCCTNITLKQKKLFIDAGFCLKTTIARTHQDRATREGNLLKEVRWG